MIWISIFLILLGFVLSEPIKIGDRVRIVNGVVIKDVTGNGIVILIRPKS